jgi:hypothetical protein
MVGGAIDPVLARQGFSQSDLILHWDDIVGTRLAEQCRPIKLQWRPRAPEATHAPEPATLLMRVEGAYALEVQHSADQIIARINAHLGWRCVGRLALRQGPVERLNERAAGHARAPSKEALAAAADQLKAIADEPLRQALARLGAHVAEKRARF